MIELFKLYEGIKHIGTVSICSRYSYVKEFGYSFGESTNDKKDSLYLLFEEQELHQKSYTELPKRVFQRRSDSKRLVEFMNIIVKVGKEWMEESGNLMSFSISYKPFYESLDDPNKEHLKLFSIYRLSEDYLKSVVIGTEFSSRRDWSFYYE